VGLKKVREGGGGEEGIEEVRRGWRRCGGLEEVWD
jgi:hypothetical protein